MIQKNCLLQATFFDIYTNMKTRKAKPIKENCNQIKS